MLAPLTTNPEWLNLKLKVIAQVTRHLAKGWMAWVFIPSVGEVEIFLHFFTSDWSWDPLSLL